MSDGRRDPVGPAAPETPAVVARFLDAVHALDPRAISECFTPGADYHALVPRPPVRGRGQIEDLFRAVFAGVDRVRWDVVTSVVGDRVVVLERVDRFWYGDREAAIECLGVIELSVDGLIGSFRDYADHQTWRERRSRARTS